MLHGWLVTWFHWVEHGGYLGVFLLMALESSLVPVPSEIVMPPAAFWAAQGRFDFWGMIAAGTAGSTVGAIAMYIVSRRLGLPVVQHLTKRYGKAFFLTEEKLLAGEAWVSTHGVVGIFVSRLLPVVRHLIGIPAGILRMPIGAFIAATATGSAIWCFVLAWFGRAVIGGAPELLDSPEQLIAVMKAKVVWIVAGVVVFAALYAGMVVMRKRSLAT